jgi:thiamine kinase-like enzyme
MNTQLLNAIVTNFGVDTSKITYKTITQGYINDTFLVKLDDQPKFILQRINSNVFKNVSGLHTNIEYALKKLKSEDYQEISLLKTTDNKSYCINNGSFWRIQSFIKDSIAHNITSNQTVAFETGRIIGRFHKLLSDENVSNYVKTVKDLNYLPFRITEFNEALKTTSEDLKDFAILEIEFAKKNMQSFDAFYNADLPERVCHNDTKLNNILFNKENKALCLIDLDTIMGGYFHYDFGDAVRTIVSEANEDEKDLSKIGFNLGLFEKFIEGLNSNGSFLTETETEFLPISCALLPFMHGLRALTDYLNGNIHYKVSYVEQNLDRSKSLFKVAQLALENEGKIKTIINNKLN